MSVVIDEFLKCYILRDFDWRHSLVYSLCRAQKLDRTLLRRVTGFDYDRTLKKICEELLSANLLARDGNSYSGLDPGDQVKKFSGGHIYTKVVALDGLVTLENYLFSLFASIAKGGHSLAGYSQSSLSKIAKMPRGTLYACLKSLEKKGFIKLNRRSVEKRLLGKVVDSEYVYEIVLLKKLEFSNIAQKPAPEQPSKKEAELLKSWMYVTSHPLSHFLSARDRIWWHIANLSVNNTRVFATPRAVRDAVDEANHAYNRSSKNSHCDNYSTFVDGIAEIIKKRAIECNSDSYRPKYVLNALRAISPLPKQKQTPESQKAKPRNQLPLRAQYPKVMLLAKQSNLREELVLKALEHSRGLRQEGVVALMKESEQSAKGKAREAGHDNWYPAFYSEFAQSGVLPIF